MSRRTLLENARVVTCDHSRAAAAAVLVDARGRIEAVGSVEALQAQAGSAVPGVDLGGRVLAPGFNDSHMHVLPYGMDLARADLSPAAGVRSVPALVEALQAWAASNPRSEWILGSRYDQNTFPGALHPTRLQLDAAFADRPVYLSHTSKHAAVANGAALRRAGIGRDTDDPAGGQIVRGPDGEPTGVLLESAAYLVARHVPELDQAGMAAAICRASEALLRVGVTAASDMGTGSRGFDLELAAYRQAAAEGARLRVTVLPYPELVGPQHAFPRRERWASEHGFGEEPADAADPAARVRLGPVKLFADGALTTRTAVVRQPYVDGGGAGILLEEPDALRAAIVAAHRAGWQVATHAIGDRAIEMVLDHYAAAQADVPRPGARHRIEHCMLLDEGLIGRLVAERVVPTQQPEFVARLGDAYVMGLGPERAARLNPYASLLRAGVPLPFGSDCPVVPGAPLDGIRAAVRRTTPSGRMLGPAERIDAREAMRCYTWWSAYATFDEANVGAIVPGARADLVLLSCDPAHDPDGCRVEGCFAAGEWVPAG